MSINAIIFTVQKCTRHLRKSSEIIQEANERCKAKYEAHIVIIKFTVRRIIQNVILKANYHFFI